MPPLPLKDIIISARQESHRMRHYYLGVEHLLIALLDVKGGIAAQLVQEQGLTPEYVIDAIRRKIGKGGKHRLWAGVPNTPRTDIILGIANDLAINNGRTQIEENDLLIALLEEEDNMAVRVLKALGLDIDLMLEHARSLKLPLTHSTQPFVQVDFGLDFGESDLSKEDLFLLRRMFHGYGSIRIERRLMGGYADSRLLVVTPVNVDKREDAPVVVKIGPTHEILDEVQRYESFVKGKLPPLTTRLEDRPTAPDSSDLAGIKYTLVGVPDQTPQDLRTVAKEWGGERVGAWLKKQLFPVFGRMWWRQNRPYRFETWREYDWLLPPLFTIEMIESAPLPPNAHVLKYPIRRARLKDVEYGDTVIVEHFTVHKIDREKRIMQLTAGGNTDSAQAYKIEVRGVNFDEVMYYRGEVVELIVGTVWKTRDEQLKQIVRGLSPDFDIEAAMLPFPDAIERLPNPLKIYNDVLDDYINGTLSTIHGDLHLGNIIPGPNENPALIDFEHTRDGHTLFDWATLEISLLNDLISPTIAGESWDKARTITRHLLHLQEVNDKTTDNLYLADTLAAIRSIREIVRECLYHEEHWGEYFISLLFYALRAMRWESLSLGNRRLMFWVAALAAHELRAQKYSSDGTPSPDQTDLHSKLSDSEN